MSVAQAVQVLPMIKAMTSAAGKIVLQSIDDPLSLPKPAIKILKDFPVVLGEPRFTYLDLFKRIFGLEHPIPEGYRYLGFPNDSRFTIFDHTHKDGNPGEWPPQDIRALAKRFYLRGFCRPETDDKEIILVRGENSVPRMLEIFFEDFLRAVFNVLSLWYRDTTLDHLVFLYQRETALGFSWWIK